MLRKNKQACTHTHTHIKSINVHVKVHLCIASQCGPEQRMMDHLEKVWLFHSPDICPVVLWAALVQMLEVPGLWASSHCCPLPAHTARISCRRPEPAGHTDTHREKHILNKELKKIKKTEANTHTTSVLFHKLYSSLQWSCMTGQNDQTLSTPVIHHSVIHQNFLTHSYRSNSFSPKGFQQC